MQLLIVNPNTSNGVTRRIDAAAHALANEDDNFITVSAAFGPELIVTDQDGLDAVDGVLASVHAHGQGVDGIVLGSFGDTGIEAVRLACPGIPVIGIANAAFSLARCISGRFSIVTFDESVAPSLRARADFYGMANQLHRVAAVSDNNPFDAANVQIERFDAINALCDECAKEPITSIIMGGGPLAGLSSRIRASSVLPIIDGTQAAIGMLRGAISR
ncbi:MAG: aspartate/glutamate racemase family protein [Granulosicoccus sp.]